MKMLLTVALGAWSLLAASPLADYCHNADHPPSWTKVATYEEVDHRFHVLDLMSQQWRTQEEIDKPEWHHWLSITEPKRVTSDKALLLVFGGSDGDAPPASARADWVALANQTGTVIIELRNVPNQPLKFTDEPDARYQALGCKEDALVAYTWDRYLVTEDPTWLSHLPMTKSVVRAMDVVQEAAPELIGREVKGFLLSGKSKRGWTAWTAASVDDRIIGVAPMVIDLLNLKHSMTHHYRSYGAWSFALDDYVDRKIPERWESDRFTDLLTIIEPYAQREAVLAPKLIVNSTGDEFFLPDSSRFYFHDLMGEKFLRYIPNVNHSLQGSDAELSLALFYKALVANRPLPKFEWRESGGKVRVTCQTIPLEVKVWSAHNPKARDFRLSTIGPAWASKTLKPRQAGQYEIVLQKPDEGWSAYLIELKFDSGERAPHIFTTDVFVAPETLPYAFNLSDLGPVIN